jgi:alkylhydroperoxidase family enzyme
MDSEQHLEIIQQINRVRWRAHAWAEKVTIIEKVDSDHLGNAARTARSNEDESERMML